MAAAASILMMTASAASAQFAYLDSADPANGSKVERLDKITMNWMRADGEVTAEGSELFWNQYSYQSAIPVYDASGTEVRKLKLIQTQDWAAGWPPPNVYTAFVMQGDNEVPITADGTYTFTIPAGLFADDEGGGNPNLATKFTYYIGEGGGNVDPTPDPDPEPVDKTVCYLNEADPDPSTTLSVLDKVVTYWYQPNGDDADFSENVWNNAELKKLPVTDASGNVVATAIVGDEVDWSNFRVHYNVFIEPNITSTGTYSFTFPAGMFVDFAGEENYPSKATTLTYKVQGEAHGEEPGDSTPDFNYTGVYPTEGLVKFENGGLATFNLDFEAAVYVNNAKKPYIELPDGSTNEASLVTTGAAFGLGQQAIFGFNGTEQYKSGNYTVVVPEGTFGNAAWNSSNHANGKHNPEIRLSYTYEQDPNLVNDDDDGTPFEVLGATLTYGGKEIDLTQEGLELDMIHGGSVLRFNTNKNEICKDAYFTITDLNADSEDERVLWLAGTYRQAQTSVEDIHTINGKNANGWFEMAIVDYYNMKLVKGHEYEVKMEVFLQYDGVPEAQKIANKKGEANFIIKGTMEGYTYADVEIVEITPNPDSAEILDPENAVFSVKFNKPVEMAESYNKCQSAQAWVAYDSVTTDDEGYTWTFKIPASVVNSAEGQVNCRFAPRYEGKSLRVEEGGFGFKALYTSGNEEFAYQVMSYACYLGGTPIAVSPAADTTVESLYTFKFTAPTATGKNIGFQGVSATGALLNGILYNEANEEVARLDRNDITGQPSGEYNLSETMHLDKEITTPGTYTLYIPGALFMTGTESNSKANCPMQFVYIIEGAPAPEDFRATACSVADNHKHSHLNVVFVDFDGAVVAASDDACFELEYDGNVVATAPLTVVNNGETSRVYGHFDNVEMSEAGTYTLVLPYGSVRAEGRVSVNSAVTANFNGVKETAPEYVMVTLAIDGYATMAHRAPKGEIYMVTLLDSDDWTLKSLTLNGDDVTEDVAGNIYLVSQDVMQEGAELVANYEYAREVDFSFTSGVTQIAGCKYSVGSEAGCIVIGGLEVGDTVKVYSVNGMAIANATATNDVASISVVPGVYIVMINDTVLKIEHK